MRMHGDRASGALARSTSLADDTSGNVAAAALPLLLATMGITLLAVGAIMTLTPLMMGGGGMTVVGFALYLIMMGLDRADSRRKGARAERKAAQRAQAERHFAADQAAIAPARNPLADDAVAALTGNAKGGIWPPLPSQAGKQAPPMWAPGAKVGTPAFQDNGSESEGLVEFDVVTEAPQMAAGPGGISMIETASTRPRVASATLEADTPARDFRVWPGAKDMDRWATFTGERRPKAARYSDDELREAMHQRRQVMAGKLPTIGAILADVDGRERSDSELEALRREATRGKCSQCSSIIWAPKKRPIVLKCPQCGHKAKLY